MGVDNATLARRYLTELWGKRNLDLVDELVDPNIVLGDPMTPEPAKGIDTVKSRIKDMSKHFTESSITVTEVVVQGDTVIARARWTGKHTGDFFGIKPTNKTIKCDSAEVIKIK